LDSDSNNNNGGGKKVDKGNPAILLGTSNNINKLWAIGYRAIKTIINWPLHCATIILVMYGRAYVLDWSTDQFLFVKLPLNPSIVSF
jgi:hypothetical protein